MPYGIANPGETPTSTDRGSHARLGLGRPGVTTFDTAPAYGDAEQRLGAWIGRRGVNAHVATKLPALVAACADADVAKAVDDAIQASTGRIGSRQRPTSPMTPPII